MRPRWVSSAIALVSGVGIAYQIALMRVFSIIQWHHFAYMIISVAMLGFGASGTVLALARKRIAGREAGLLSASAWGMAVSLPLCYALGQRIPFDTFRLTMERGQLAWLFLLYVVLAVPFFLMSTCLALSFMANPGKAARLYAVNMLGSGAGALASPGLLFAVSPASLACGLAVPALAAALLMTVGITQSRAWRKALAPVAVLVLTGAVALPRLVPPRPSEYKALAYALQAPDAKVVATRYSPLSVVTAVASDTIRETPGQVSNYPMGELGPFPEQIALFYDAGAVSPVNRFDGDYDRLAFLDYVTSALAYRLTDQPSVLVLGAGGGTHVLSALYHRAEHVTAVEVDPNVVGLLQEEFRSFSGGLYGRPDVAAVVAEGRGFLQADPAAYDLIQVPLFGAFNAASAGVHALNESYLYTLEAFELFLDRLTPNGVLALDCWLKTPPRDAIKLFATAVEACERAGITDPARHVVFIRSWNNATICVSRAPLTEVQIALARDFCRARWFDLCHCPDLRASEVNHFVALEEPVYYNASQALLGPGREAFYRDFLFHIRPPTDDRPYFFRFFKWAALPRLLSGMGTEWLPFVEWGYVTLIMTVAQSVVAGAVLILLPLAVLGRDPAGKGAKRWVILYFGCLGVAYMFLEIALIQKFMLFLAYPVYAVAVVLTALLVFSGLGGLACGAFHSRSRVPVALAVAGIAGLAGLELVMLPGLFGWSASWTDGAKIAVSVGALAPLAFCMGIPFPMGLRRVMARHASLLPWAWGINGCASVIGATLATLTAVHSGFRTVVLAAAIAYLVATYAYGRLGRVKRPVAADGKS
jgi:spermidine synthase